MTLLQIEEQSSQIDKWKEALSVLAEVRDSERLRQFLITGLDRTYPAALTIHAY